MSRLRLLAAGLALVALACCEAAPLTAPDGSSIFLQANPEFVIANGGISVVTAVVTEPAGTFVPDGTEVSFFTNLGRIDPVGKTVRGVASVNFVADARSGDATVTAISGQKPGSTPPNVTIHVGNGRPTRVLVISDPPVLTAQQRNARITATVFDDNGNPVQNVPVAFALDDSAVDERLDSGGALQYTNSNGQVFDTLHTQALSGTTAVSVTVTATTANGISSTVNVGINIL